MTLTQFSYIIAIDNHKSFAEAANNCFVTQPTLSMQVKKLEEELGVRIFDRSKQPVKATEIGKKIIESEPIQSVKVKEALEEFSQENELNYEQNITLNHLSRFKRYSVEDSEKIISELEDKIGLRQKVAVRIVDLIPQDLSDLRLIFAKEATHIEKEQMEDILEILDQYTIIE